MTNNNKNPDGPVYEREFEAGHEDSLGKLAGLIDPDSTILELGPAAGYFTRFMVGDLHCVVDCVEISRLMAKKAKPYCRKLVVEDLDRIFFLDHFNAATYDYIVAADVIEHLKRPDVVLKACAKLLKSNGKLLLSIPNVSHVAVLSQLFKGDFNYTDRGLIDRTHLRFFTRKTLVALLTDCGFKIVYWDTIALLPEDTEVADDFYDLPQNIQEIMINRPDALTYQFIVSAVQGRDAKRAREILSHNQVAPFKSIRKSRNVQLRRELKKIQKALAEAQQLVAKREMELTRVQSALQEAQAIVRAKEKDIGELEERLTRLQSALQEAQAFVKQREKDIAGLEKRLDRTTSALQEAQAFVRAREKDIAELEEKLNQLNQAPA